MQTQPDFKKLKLEGKDHNNNHNHNGPDPDPNQHPHSNPVTTTMTLTRHLSSQSKTYTFKDFKNPQDLCMQFSKSNNNLPVFAIDVSGANKDYMATSYKNLVTSLRENWKKGKKSHPYEIALEDLPCHIFIDADAYPCMKENASVDFQKLHLKFMEDLSEYLLEMKYADKKEDIAFYILDSSRKDKFSKHYVVRIRGKVWKNHYHVGSLMRHFQNWLFEKVGGDFSKSPYWIATYADKDKKTGLDYSFYVDLAVYTLNRVFRTVYSQKLVGGKPLLPFYYKDGKEVAITSHTQFLNSSNIYNYFLQYDIQYGDILTCYTYDGTEPFSTNKVTYERLDTLSEGHIIFQGKRSLFFKESFPSQDIWKRFGHKNREWMFDYAKKSNNVRQKVRPHRPFFNNYEEFEKYITNENKDIIGVHVGGLFEEQNNKSKVLSFNFVLDCDIPSWKDEEGEPLRLCCGNRKGMCKECWPIIALTYYVLKFILEELMDLRNNEFYFSGSKGIHVWIDPDNERLHSIVDPFKRRKFYNLFSSYSKWKGDMLMETGVEGSDEGIGIRSRVKELLGIIDESSYLKSPSPPPSPTQNSEKQNSLLNLYWPRIDKLPFENQGHNGMIRCPHSLHTSSNRKVERMYDPIKFFQGLYGNFKTENV